MSEDTRTLDEKIDDLAMQLARATNVSFEHARSSLRAVIYAPPTAEEIRRQSHG